MQSTTAAAAAHNSVTPLHIVSANINGLRGKHKALYAHVTVEHPHALCVQETKVATGTIGNFCIPGYQLFRRDRTEGGGGVGIYVAESLHPYKVAGTDCASELLAVGLRVNEHHKLCIINGYRAPDYDKVTFFDDVEAILSVVHEQFDGVVLCGDFNVCYHNDVIDSFTTIETAFNITQTVREVTHHQRCIDLMFVSVGLVADTSVGEPFENVHKSIGTKIDIPVIEPRPTASRRVWNFEAANWPLFRAIIQRGHLVKGIMDSATSDEALTLVNMCIMQAATVAIPSKIVTPGRRRHNNPWMNPELRKLYRQKKEAFDRRKRTGAEADKQAFSRLRKRWKKAEKLAVRQHLASAFDDCNNIGQFYQAVKWSLGKQQQAIAARC